MVGVMLCRLQALARMTSPRLATASAIALALAWAATVVSSQGAPPGGDPDVLYQDREQLASATRAAETWSARLAADGKDFDAAWKLARARSWIGERGARDGRKAQYELGMAAARRAIAIEPQRPEGHFWLAVNMGSLASAAPIRAGLRHRVAIRETLETVISLEPGYSRGAGHCALGKYYLQVPWLFGGSKSKAEKSVRACLVYDEANAMARYFLAQTLVARHRARDARTELEKVMEAPEDAAFGPETRLYKRKAARLLKKISGG